MAMQLTRIIDPRDNLGRATRDELWDFAKANGVTFEVGQAVATKPYMETKLRALGLVNIQPAVRFQGRPTGEHYPAAGSSSATEPTKVVEVDAEKDMLRQMKEQASQAAQASQPNDWPVESTHAPKTVAEMSMNELRAECKRRSVKMDRRDNMNTLREKLGGGQNTP